MRLFKGKAGFILVELIIATAILAAVIPLSKFFIDTIKATREAKIQQTANHLAQKYMEEYKGKSLSDLYTVLEPGTVLNDEVEINRRNYKVNVVVDWDVPEAKNLIGTVWIETSGSGVSVTLKSNKGEEKSGDAFIEPRYDLKLDELNRLSWEDMLPVSFDLPEGEPKELNLIVDGNPDLELNVKNRCAGIEKLVINKTEIKSTPDEISNFELFIEKEIPVGIDIDALIRDTEQAKESELGANIVVTVRNAENTELVKIAETRKIEWPRSYEVPQS